MSNEIKITEVFPVQAKVLYDAWLSSEEHTNFTGINAEINPKLGGKFQAGDGYMTGRNLQLQPYGRIVQSWRTTEFPETALDSTVEILLQKVDGGTKFTLIHSGIPPGDEQKYEDGWRKYYINPMKEYFAAKAEKV